MKRLLFVTLALTALTLSACGGHMHHKGHHHHTADCKCGEKCECSDGKSCDACGKSMKAAQGSEGEKKACGCGTGACGCGAK